MSGFLVGPVNPRSLKNVSNDIRIYHCVRFGFISCFEKEINRINFISDAADKISYF